MLSPGNPHPTLAQTRLAPHTHLEKSTWTRGERAKATQTSLAGDLLSFCILCFSAYQHHKEMTFPEALLYLVGSLLSHLRLDQQRPWQQGSGSVCARTLKHSGLSAKLNRKEAMPCFPLGKQLNGRARRRQVKTKHRPGRQQALRAGHLLSLLQPERNPRASGVGQPCGAEKSRVCSQIKDNSSLRKSRPPETLGPEHPRGSHSQTES